MKRKVVGDRVGGVEKFYLLFGFVLCRYYDERI